MSLPSNFAGQSLLNEANTLSLISASSLNAMKWLHACSAYLSTPLTSANISTLAKITPTEKCIFIPSTFNTAIAPKTVMNIAMRCPIIPIITAIVMNPASGFTIPISPHITANPLLFFLSITAHLLIHSFQDSSVHPRAWHIHRQP